MDKTDWVMGRTLETQARTRGDQSFIQLEDGPPVTYAEAHRRANRVGNGLLSLGVEFGERVGLMLPNSLDYLWAFAGITRTGAVAVTVNTAYRGMFLEHVLNDSNARLLIIHPAYLEWLAEIEGSIPQLTTAIVLDWDGVNPGLKRINLMHYESLLDGADTNICVEVTYCDIGGIMYTSGTTGPSKGVLMSHGHMYLLAHSAQVHLRLAETDVCFQTMPLFHAMGMYLQLYGTMLAGARAVMSPFFSATSWSSDIRKYGITVTSTLGVMTEFILRQPPHPDDLDNKLTRVLAVPVTEAVTDQFVRRFGVDKVIEAFGMTECGMPVWFPYDDQPRPGSCGKAWEDFYEVRIVDPDSDEELPRGEIGEIVIRPKEPFGFMQGYNGSPEKTLEAWRNFWLHSGDAGYQDADGYFWYMDRIKDAIRRRGENISSYEVEFVLAAHPAIEEAAAVAIPSEFRGGEDEVLACLVIKEGQTRPAPEEILDFCVTRMPYFAVPRFIEFLDELPKTPSQKIRKAELRDLRRAHDIWDRESVGYKVERKRAR